MFSKCSFVPLKFMVLMLVMVLLSTIAQAQQAGAQVVSDQVEIALLTAECEATLAMQSLTAFAYETTAFPPAGTTDLCDYYRKKLDDYNTLLAAGYLTLLQCDYAVSQALEQKNLAQSTLDLQNALLALMLQRGNYSAQEIADQEAQVAAAEQALNAAISKLEIADRKRAGTERYLARIAKLRTDAENYLNENCGGVQPVPNPVPVPDPMI